MENKDKKDLEEILVYGVPCSNGEAFANLVTGRKPNVKPLRMTRIQYKELRRMGRIGQIGLVSVLALGAYFNTKGEVEKYGSLGRAYEVFMANSERAPWHAVFGH